MNLTTKRKRVSWLLFMLECMILFVTAPSCNNKNDKTTTTGDDTTKKEETTATTPSTGQQQANLTEANFYYLTLDSAILVDSFFKKPNNFKKILLSFKVNNFSSFPATLTMNARATKNNDEMLDDNPEILNIKTDTTTVPLPTDVLFSTQEISRNKLKNLVGNNGTARRYKYLLFIPKYKEQNGARYLYYRIECRPKISDAQEPFEDLNPCPPHRPNE